jgi:hypothetical protein
MLGQKEAEMPVAITTFGMNNHTVKTKRYRYIQYEDGGEEFYDHANDSNEFTNQAENREYQNEIAALKKWLPKTNAIWDPNSSYTFQPYFVEHKARTSGADLSPVKVIGAPR